MILGMIINYLNGGTQHNSAQIYKTGMYETELLFRKIQMREGPCRRVYPGYRTTRSWDCRGQLKYANGVELVRFLWTSRR